MISNFAFMIDVQKSPFHPIFISKIYNNNIILSVSIEIIIILPPPPIPAYTHIHLLGSIRWRRVRSPAWSVRPNKGACLSLPVHSQYRKSKTVQCTYMYHNLSNYMSFDCWVWHTLSLSFCLASSWFDLPPPLSLFTNPISPEGPSLSLSQRCYSHTDFHEV